MVSHNSNSGINDNKTTFKTSFTIWKCTYIFKFMLKCNSIICDYKNIQYIHCVHLAIMRNSSAGNSLQKYTEPSLQRVKAIEQKLLIRSKLFNIDTFPVNYFGAKKSTCNLVLVLTELETNGTQRILLLFYKVCNRYTATC